MPEVVPVSIVSARTFNQSPSQVKTLAADGPVFVTDRGRASLVVLAMNDYERLTGGGSIRESLAMPDGDDIDFEPVVSRSLGRVEPL